MSLNTVVQFSPDTQRKEMCDSNSVTYKIRLGSTGHPFTSLHKRIQRKQEIFCVVNSGAFDSE